MKCVHCGRSANKPPRRRRYKEPKAPKPKPLPRVTAAREIAVGGLNAFVISDHTSFSDNFAVPEPADTQTIETFNREGYEILCRDHHWRVRGETYDAVIHPKTRYFHLARLEPPKGFLAKIARWLRSR